MTLHVAMGGRWETEGDWRDDLHKPAIVIGTADVLVSAALVRSFAVGRAIAPIDFALVTNGAHWLIDEPQLSPQATTTMRQLAGFAASNRHRRAVRPDLPVRDAPGRAARHR